MAFAATGNQVLPWASPWAGTGDGPGLASDVGAAFPNTEFAPALPGQMTTTAAVPLHVLNKRRGMLGEVTTGRSGSSAIVDNGKVMCTHQYTTRRSVGDADLFVRVNHLMFMLADDTAHPTQTVLTPEARTLSSINAMLLHDAELEFDSRDNAIVGDEKALYNAFHGFSGCPADGKVPGGHGNADTQRDAMSLLMRPDAFRAHWRPYGVCMAVSTSDEAELKSYAVVSHTESISGWSRVLNYWGVCGFDVDLWLAVVLVFVPRQNYAFTSGKFHCTSFVPLTGTKPPSVMSYKLADDGRVLRDVHMAETAGDHGDEGVYCWQVVPVSTLQRSGPTEGMLKGRISVLNRTRGAAAGTRRFIHWEGYAVRIGSSNFNHIQGIRNPGLLETQAQAARVLTHPFEGNDARERLDRAYGHLASTNVLDAYLGM